ncbi:hypothetical protein [Acidianus brierleyi]|uniref:Uncharacterized protein n=1 Tax=Acidianus brierleyi TaxID=41673 RepID=A0A2U9IDW4_9CREN|nr:hypothetical protein [Acidianus brierleyi]AWR94233.1 hypothetical protein DFR85_06135 [Acidianus brierleyi]
MNLHLLFFLFLLLSPHMFVEYKIHSTISNEVICNVILENVSKTFPNGTFAYTIQVFFMNYSKYTQPSIVYDNLTNPQTFFYIPKNELGKSAIDRQIPLTLVNESNGTYVYFGKQFVDYVEIEDYYFVNSTGVPSKIEIIQIGENGGIVSVTTYTLIRTNIFQNETPFMPKGFSLENSSLKLPNQSLSDSLGTYVILFNIIVIPLLLTLYKVRKK